MKLIKILIIFLIVISKSFSSDVFNFLRDASGARAAGLAGSFVTVENDISSVYYNPALLSTAEENNNLAVTFFKHALDINSGNIVFKLPYNWEGGIFSVNTVFTNYGAFDYFDKDGIKNGTFSANNLAIACHYSNILDSNIFYGVGIKYIFSNIEKYSSSAVAVDAGVFYRMKDGRTNLGLSVLNAGTQLTSYNGENESLPLDIRVGFNHKLKGMPLLFNASFNHLADKTESFFTKFKSFSVGGEFNVGKFVDLRLGFDNHVRTVLTNEVEKGFAGFCGGLGVKTDYLNFDYALSIYNSAVKLHRVSVSLNL